MLVGWLNKLYPNLSASLFTQVLSAVLSAVGLSSVYGQGIEEGQQWP